MIHSSLDDALFERLLARFDEIGEPISLPTKDALLGALRAAGWRPAGGLRHGAALRRARTDLELAQAIRDGDAVAAEELFDRYRGKLVAYARGVGCPNDAEDFVQAAFVALLTTAPLNTPSFNVRGYLFKVVRNRAIKQTLRHAREPGLDEAGTVPDEEAHSQLDRLIIQHDLKRAAKLIEACCNPAEQAVLALTHSDVGAAEIAAQLEIKPGYVRVIRHRALAKLRAAFNEDPS